MKPIYRGCYIDTYEVDNNLRIAMPVSRNENRILIHDERESTS